VPHRVVGRQTRGEVGASNADDDTIRGREHRQRVVDRLVPRWVDVYRVQQEVDDGRDNDDHEKPRDHGPDALLCVCAHELILAARILGV